MIGFGIIGPAMGAFVGAHAFSMMPPSLLPSIPIPSSIGLAALGMLAPLQTPPRLQWRPGPKDWSPHGEARMVHDSKFR